ncbi:MAG: PIN domain-containing protein [Patescibacteria group bacterium]
MLIDTNIFLEILFKQERRQECIDLLDAIKENLIAEKIYITRFSLGAIEASTKKKHTEFIRELLLLIYDNKINIPKMNIRDDLMINSVRNELGLDFDDAMQFVATQKAGTYIVTFDKDFKNKPIQVKTPKEVLKTVLK